MVSIQEDLEINKKNQSSAEEIVLDVMRHFGFRRNYQVAEYFEVTPQTLSGWIKSGEIPPKHLMKYLDEVSNSKKNISLEFESNQNRQASQFKYDEKRYKKNPIDRIKFIFKSNIYGFLLIPLLTTILAVFYVFVLANPVFTSKSKVLPISDDGGSSNSFSGFASQLGINIPLNIGGKVPWDEIYPEIIKSRDLLGSMLDINYSTVKYGDLSLYKIILNENKIKGIEDLDKRNRAIDILSGLVLVKKDRSSPIVNIDVMAFEPKFAVELSKDLISISSQIQRQLKTNRVKKKRLFIEERLNQVSIEMKEMEKDLREFRENNRNLSSSPSLQMKVQEMGREADLQNSLYITLKTQYEKAKIDEVGRDDMVQQIDGPSFPTKLTSPRRVLTISMSFFIGLFFSLFIIFLKEEYVY